MSQVLKLKWYWQRCYQLVGLLNGKQVRIKSCSVKGGQILFSLSMNREEIGGRMLARIAKKTGLTSEDL